VERTLHEFRYCGKGGPKVGSIKVKGEGMGTGTLPANGGSPSGALGFTASLEMSLFYDALKFSWPLVYFTEGTKGMKLTMFGLLDLMDIPAPPH
jgi:hypothetical protein